MNIRTALSRSLGVDRRRPLRREIPNRIATFRMVSGGRLMRFAISSDDRAFAASSSKRRSSAKDQRCFLRFPVIETMSCRASNSSPRSPGVLGIPKLQASEIFPAKGISKSKAADDGVIGFRLVDGGKVVIDQMDRADREHEPQHNGEHRRNDKFQSNCFVGHRRYSL
jgi:hypothetical protein